MPADGRRRGSPATARPRAVALLRWAAVLSLFAAISTWAFFVVDDAGRVAVRALGEDRADAPVDVMAAPRVLRLGEDCDLAVVLRELRAGGYREVARTPREPGEYRRAEGLLDVVRRAAPAPYGEGRGEIAPGLVRIACRAGIVDAIEFGDGRRGRAAALEPVRIGSFRGPVLAERRPLPLARFPRRLVEAVLAAEDSRFLEHRGLDPRGIARALWKDMTGTGPLQGGSTITQQVIKNRLVGHDRTWLRKGREAVLAAYVEGKVSKDRLLEIYLNEIYLGQDGAVSVMGMPAAARFYFGRDVEGLSLQQMALLAGIIASPGRFDPRARPENARERLRWVLSRMAENGFLTDAEAAAAGNAPLGVVPPGGSLDSAGDVLDAVARELAARGVPPRPSADRIVVHTSLDLDLQAVARHALDATLDELEKDRPERAPLDGAVVVLDVGTGDVLALVGGRAGTRGGFHRALDARRQPGSAFKPFVALAAFASRRFVPATTLEDAPLNVPTARGAWTPENYDHAFRGTVTLRRAIEESLNVPVVRVALDVGPAEITRWAARAGLTGLPEQPAVALGAGEVSPLALAQAYATLATGGTRNPAALVRAVSHASTSVGEGEAPVLAPRPGSTRVLPPEDCWLVLDVMTGTIERGTAKALAAATRGVRVAAKTGTTQDGRDAWFVLVTGRTVTVVYVGRDDHGPASLTGARAALPVVRGLLEAAGGRLLAPLPPPPEGIRLLEVDPSTGGLATSRCPQRVLEAFPADSTPRTCSEHASFWRRLRDRFGGGSAGRGAPERRR